MIGSPFVCPTPFYLRFILAPCSTGSGGPRNEDIPRTHFAKFPKFATSRSRANSLISPRIISILSRNSSLERDGTSPPCSPHSPSSFDFLFLHASIIFSLSGTVLHTLWSDGVQSPMAFSILPSLGLVSLVASSVDTLRSFALRPRSRLFFSSNSPLVTRSPRTRRKETAPL